MLGLKFNDLNLAEKKVWSEMIMKKVLTLRTEVFFAAPPVTRKLLVILNPILSQDKADIMSPKI